MKILFYNLGYFFREVKTSIQLNLFTNIFSAISIGLILFILAMVISGWWASKHFIEMIQQEAEINVFFDESLDESKAIQLAESIRNLHGVRKVRIVDEGEAYDRMVNILGQEAQVLEVFETNPFTPYIEVNIILDETGVVLERLNKLPRIEYIRDNQEILNRLQSIVRVLSVLGYLGLVAVAISTLIIISHIIKLGIFSRKDQINTLRLLGASENFIAFPFLLEGILIAFMGSILAVALIVPSAKLIQVQILDLLPFLPLPSPEKLMLKLSALIIGLSISFGLFGSLVGLSSARES